MKCRDRTLCFRILAAIMSIMLVVCNIPTSAFAATAVVEENPYYNGNDQTSSEGSMVEQNPDYSEPNQKSNEGPIVEQNPDYNVTIEIETETNSGQHTIILQEEPISRPLITAPRDNANLDKKDFRVKWSCDKSYPEYVIKICKVITKSQQTVVIEETTDGNEYWVDSSELEAGKQYRIFVGVKDGPNHSVGDSIDVYIQSSEDEDDEVVSNLNYEQGNITVPQNPSSSSNTITEENRNIMFIWLNSPYMLMNGSRYQIDYNKNICPKMIDGITYIPIRPILEKLGGTVHWTKQETTLSLNNNKIAVSNGNYRINDGRWNSIQVKTIEGAMYLPLRQILEPLGMRIDYRSEVVAISEEYHRLTDTEVGSIKEQLNGKSTGSGSQSSKTEDKESDYVSRLGNAVVYGHDAVKLANDKRLYVVGSNGAIYRKVLKNGKTSDEYICSADIFEGYEGETFFSGDPKNSHSKIKLYRSRSSGDKLFSIVPEKLQWCDWKISEQQYIKSSAKDKGYTYVYDKAAEREKAIKDARKGTFTSEFWDYYDKEYLAERQYEGYTFNRIVEDVQNKLTILGYVFSKIDGKYGEEVFNAVAYFQMTNGLDVTGQLDEETYEKIREKAEEQQEKNRISTAQKSLVQKEAERIKKAREDETIARQIIEEYYKKVIVSEQYKKLLDSPNIIQKKYPVLGPIEVHPEYIKFTIARDMSLPFIFKDDFFSESGTLFPSDIMYSISLLRNQSIMDGEFEKVIELEEIMDQALKKENVLNYINGFTESIANQTKEELKQGARQIILGNWCDNVTVSGTVGVILLGVFDLDLPSDIRDISYDVSHWEWSKEFGVQFAVDVVGIFPVIGALKYGDEAKYLVKGADDISDVAEGVAKGINAKVLEAMKNPNYKKYLGIDCSEIAEDLYNASGKSGKIYRITGTGKGGWMKGYEYGRIEDYIYHEVYCDGKYIFDPRYSDVPVLKDDYFKALRDINPDGFYVKELP